MDRQKETASERLLSDKSEIEQANIRMDREFYGDTDIDHPEETTVPFINRNQS
ncbi:hypothetical protein [Paenibacillus sp. V4I5]|uniref:hypothetical protein n=1 Tax=Paenibacillus sp. V4I5 TaxID=3042306 RepID=UPI0027917CB6|nr:hypothetical protein [Paenibacillus sp. V4I5]MDQ0914986.1 hypothetical protein [Paenibacillus sp. V4I5]